MESRRLCGYTVGEILSRASQCKRWARRPSGMPPAPEEIKDMIRESLDLIETAVKELPKTCGVHDEKVEVMAFYIQHAREALDEDRYDAIEQDMDLLRHLLEEGLRREV